HRDDRRDRVRRRGAPGGCELVVALANRRVVAGREGHRLEIEDAAARAVTRGVERRSERGARLELPHHASIRRVLGIAQEDPPQGLPTGHVPEGARHAPGAIEEHPHLGHHRLELHVPLDALGHLVFGASRIEEHGIDPDAVDLLAAPLAGAPAPLTVRVLDALGAALARRAVQPRGAGRARVAPRAAVAPELRFTLRGFPLCRGWRSVVLLLTTDEGSQGEQRREHPPPAREVSGMVSELVAPRAPLARATVPPLLARA